MDIQLLILLLKRFGKEYIKAYSIYFDWELEEDEGGRSFTFKYYLQDYKQLLASGDLDKYPIVELVDDVNIFYIHIREPTYEELDAMGDLAHDVAMEMNTDPDIFTCMCGVLIKMLETFKSIYLENGNHEIVTNIQPAVLPPICSDYKVDEEGEDGDLLMEWYTPQVRIEIGEPIISSPDQASPQ